MSRSFVATHTVSRQVLADTDGPRDALRHTQSSSCCAQRWTLSVMDGRRWPAMSPFDKPHMTSYSTVMETMRLSLYRFRVTASYLSKVAHFNLPHLHLVPSLEWLRSNFAEIFGDTKVESPGCRVALLLWSYVSRFDTIPACMGRTDRPTHRHTDRRTDTRWRL